MSGRVPTQRYEPSPEEILIGAPVSSGRQWLPMAHLANWLNGSGAELVPTSTVAGIMAGSQTRVFNFRAYTREQAIERVWTLMVRADAASAFESITIKAPASTGTAMTVSVSAGRDTSQPIIYREILSTQTSAVTNLSIEVTTSLPSIDFFITVDSIACTELARPLLAEDTTDNGVNTETERPRERIYGVLHASATGVVNASLTDIRRVGLYHWSGAGVTTTSTSYVDLVALPVPVLAPLLTSGQTTGSVYWSAYAKVSGGSGDVRLSYHSTTDSVNVTATSFAWTTPRAISIDCEDMTTADGRRAAAWDTVLPSVRKNTSGTMYIDAVSVWNQAY